MYKHTRLLVLAYLLFTNIVLGQSYIVSNTNLSGDGSLNGALAYANDNFGPDTIHFNLEGEGPFYLSTELPVWDSGTIIDASTQPDYYLGKIVIGENADEWGTLSVFGDACEFYGLALELINLFGADAAQIGQVGKGNLLRNIFAENSDDCIIQANLIGTNAEGTESVNSEGSGIRTIDCDDMLIGGDLPEDGNLVSGKEKDGMELQDPTRFIIKNNKVGTDISGTYAIPNGRDGINNVVHAPVTIGEGPSTGNLVSGNMRYGIVTASISGGSSIIAGNKVGTDISGELPIPNGEKGMWISGGTPVRISENIVAFHSQEGIYTNDVVNKKLIVENSFFCNEMGGYTINLEEALSIEDLSVSLISGQGPVASTIDLYYTGEDACLDGPCQGKHYLGSTTTNSDGQWTFTGDFAPGQYMVNATKIDQITSMISDCYNLEVTHLNGLEKIAFRLDQNNPNPFTKSTQIAYQSPVNGKAICTLYDGIGQVLYQKEIDALAGENVLTIDQSIFPSNGIYIYRIDIGEYSDTKKMIFSR